MDELHQPANELLASWTKVKERPEITRGGNS